MEELTEEKVKNFKSKISIDQPLDTLVQESLKVGPEPDDDLLKEKAESKDCQTFSFDIKLLSINGSICESGKLDLKGSVFGVEIGHTTADLSKGEACWNPKVGKLVGVKYCFYMKNKCFYTKGEIDGWFKKRTKWNQKILCF